MKYEKRQSADIPKQIARRYERPEFKAHYEEEKQALILAIKIAQLREKKAYRNSSWQSLWEQPAGDFKIESGEYEASRSRPWKRSPKQPECGLKSSSSQHSLLAGHYSFNSLLCQQFHGTGSQSCD